MKSQTLIFDLDDTLIHCRKYFVEAISKFINVLHEWFPLVTCKEIEEKQLELDLKSVEENGLSSERFPDSLVSTFLYFSKIFNRNINENELQFIRKIGKSVFQAEIQPLPDMYDVLDTLQEDGHQLFLFTGGDEANQNRKIQQLELFKYFKDRVFIFKHKNTNALKQLLATIKADHDTIWVIGNSLKTDIIPGLELGLNTIHIPAEQEWLYNNQIESILPSQGKMIKLGRLQELPPFIKEYSSH